MLNALLLAAHASAATVKTDASARQWVATAIERMGGPAALSSMSTLRLEWVGYRNLLEQSERPEGPWIPQIERTVEIRDVRAGRWDETTEATVADDTYSIRTIVADGAAARRFGETWGPAGEADIVEAKEWMALAPQQLLLDAAAAPDLRHENRAILAELLRVSRVGFAVLDLRRHRVPPVLVAVAGRALFRSRVSMLDGVASVRQAYTAAEAQAIARSVAPTARALRVRPYGLLVTADA